LSAPFHEKAVELVKLEQRYVPGLGGGFFGFGGGRGLEWGENGIALARDYDRNRRWARTFLIDLNKPGAQPRLIWERSIRDRYKDPGVPLQRTLANGRHIMWQQGDAIFLAGAGAPPKGEFPFLDRYDLATGKTERLFQCADKQYESVLDLISPDGTKFITRHESPTDAPNYFVRTANAAQAPQELTHFPDPQPQLRGITKQLVTYKRADGVQLSFTLYLPPGYKQGERLPTIIWAYPLEFNDASTAGQVSGSPYHFTTINGISQLFLVTQGYAVLDNATMPVAGNPETMNNTYVEQVVSSAKAAIDKAVEMGVTDRDRVGVGGHSYGAFMTANLLIHGMADDNSGTFPVQSERMYEAIKGNGGIVRYVQLPYEAHGYLARE